MAKIDVTSNFRSWQYNMMVPQFCVPVWDWFMNACLMTGKLKKYIFSDWTAPRVQQLDPVKETNALVLGIQAGLTTWSETIREMGRDPQEFLDEVIQERKALQDAGINFSSIILAPDDTKEEKEKKGMDKKEEKDTEKETEEKNTEKKDTKNKTEKDTKANDKNKQETKTENSENETVPAVAFGVGGTQSVIEVIGNPELSYNQKLMFLIEWFGLTEEKAKKLLGEESEQSNNTNEDEQANYK
jgi:hypothetical protein